MLALLVATGAWGCGDDGRRAATHDAGATADASVLQLDSGMPLPDARTTADTGVALADASATRACGARAGDTCTAFEYCDFPDDLCGAADGEGVCRPRPTACDRSLARVCGCSGRGYGNACLAAEAGHDVGTLCVPELGLFTCGSRLCEVNAEYCEVRQTRGGAVYDCKPLPDPCRAAIEISCACFASEACGARCTPGEGTRYTLTCRDDG